MIFTSISCKRKCLIQCVFYLRLITHALKKKLPNYPNFDLINKKENKKCPNFSFLKALVSMGTAYTNQYEEQQILYLYNTAVYY